MNEHNTLEKMRRMRMNAMATLYHRCVNEHLYQDYSLDDFLSLLVDTEWESRQSRNIESLILRAGFKQDAAASDIDYQTTRNLDKTTFERLLSLNFISKKENLIITGPTGLARVFLLNLLESKLANSSIKPFITIPPDFLTLQSWLSSKAPTIN